MYTVDIEVKDSPIEGKGVFASTDIKAGQILWQFEPSHDKTLSVEEFEALDTVGQQELHKVGYLSPWSGLWVYPPPGDLARFTNHSDNNNMTVVYDEAVSTEPYFIANRDILAGEELTNNYRDFDKIAQEQGLGWESDKSLE